MDNDYQLGNWLHQSTWHIVYKDTKLPLCEFEHNKNVLPLTQHISARKTVYVCKDCEKKLNALQSV